MIKVLLVDDHELVRIGISRLLENADGIEVVAEADSGETAIEQVKKSNPDVILMDVSMPGIGGLEATRRLSQTNPLIPIVIVTVHSEEPFPNSLLKAGAVGYLHKGCSVDEIVLAIRSVHEGKRYLSNQIAQGMAHSLLSESEASPFEKLSSREMQVLIMLVNGNRSGEIAKTLNLSPKTISTYRTRLFDKLKVHNEAEMTRLASRYGVLEGIE
ncbi:MAG: response regulator [Chromatiales bacterium]|nr:response regulator [Chromatiales bacterium]